MNKKGVFKLIIIFLLISIFITGAYIALKRGWIKIGVHEKEDEKEEDEEFEEVVVEDERCNYIEMNIEDVDCLKDEYGINVTVYRKQDDFGEGKLILNLTGKDGESKILKKSNFSYGRETFKVNNVRAGNIIEVRAGVELSISGETISCKGINLTYECRGVESEDNESGLSSLVPNPAGNVRALDIRDEFGEYFCNNETNPEHGIRIYSYKKINNTEVLSDEFIESGIATNICDYYPGLNEVYYSIKWEWGVIEGVDGYKLYQYYKDDYNNITREYDYSIRILGNNIFRDTGLDLWKPDEAPVEEVEVEEEE